MHRAALVLASFPLLALLPTACSPSSPGPFGDPLPSAQAEGPARALRDATLATSQAYDTVRSLTDEAGPRLAGSAGGAIAVAWGVRTLEAAGLAHVHTEPVTAPRWERGAEHGELVAPRREPLALAALGGSVGTPPEGLEADVVEMTSLEAIDRADPAAIKGKIVFYYVKMERTRDGSGYGRAVGVRGAGAIRAAKLGAVGVVIRSIGTDDSRFPHTGAMRYADDVAKIPAAALATPDADMLHRLLATGKPARLRMSLGAQTLPDAEAANVVGDVEGSGAPGEIVLLGAHLDSWDLGRGALDDGAGCAIVIEAGRQLARLARKPRRTVRVVLFANEENGLAGARAYGKAHEAELGRHALAMEADLGAGRVYEARFLGGPGAVPTFRPVAASVEALGVTFSPGEAEGGADLIPLVAAGVPVMDLRQDASAYFDVHHTANDTLERVKKDDLDQVAAAYAAAAYTAADTAGDFGRIPEDKRKRR
jgi:Zn-dependent M28 family amino/carboxypeptidase